MSTSPSRLSTSAREALSAALRLVLIDGLDLYTQLKVAHWNIRGPHFAALHPLFEQFATALGESTDGIAERAVTLGGLARGTARQVASSSRLPEYATETTRDLAHVRLLADRIDAFLVGVRGARVVADEHRDVDTADLLTGILAAFEKNAWFLRATLNA